MTTNLTPIKNRKLSAKATFDVAEFVKTVGHLDEEGLWHYDRYWDDTRVAEKLGVTKHNVGYARNEFIGPCFIKKSGPGKGGPAKEISMAAAIELKEQIANLSARMANLEQALGIVPPAAPDEASPKAATWFGGRGR